MPRSRRLDITAVQSNGRAEIRIDGDISAWSNSAAAFRAQAIALVGAGVRDAHVYLNTRGGSVFEANEIVNEIKRFPGRVTGEGGSLVASAGTNIMLHLEDFAMPSNGMVMLHKATWYAEGNEDQMASALELLKKLTQQYRAAYAKAMKKTEEEVEKMWARGDVWLTAQEALDLGLIARLSDEVVLDEEAVQDLAAAGAPKDKLPKASAEAPKPTTMDIKALRAALGMPESATDEQVLARAKELRETNERQAREADERRKADVKAMIDAAIKDRKITEDHRSSFEAKFAADFSATKKELEALVPAPVMAKVVEQPGAATPAAKGREAWDYAKWMELDEKGLRAMMTTDPDRFSALYEARFGMKPTLPEAKA